MTRADFVRKWGKHIPPPLEEFERDVDSLVKSERARIASALRRASEDTPKFRDVVMVVADAIEKDRWVWKDMKGGKL